MEKFKEIEEFYNSLEYRKEGAFKDGEMIEWMDRIDVDSLFKMRAEELELYLHKKALDDLAFSRWCWWHNFIYKQDF